MFNLGDRVLACVLGEITEIRKVGANIKYTVAGEDFNQAYVTADRLEKRGEDDVTTKGSITKRK